MQMNHTLFFSALIAALGGFIFGFDTVVISGAEQKFEALWAADAAQAFADRFKIYGESPTQEQLITLGKWIHGFATGAALWGTVLGSLIGAFPTDRFGRKRTLLSIGLFYFVSAVWSGLAPDVYSFMIARFIGGIGVGVSTIAAPLYIAEISPPLFRGRLTGMFQFNIVFGILIAFLSNFVIHEIDADEWRWMLGIEGFPALIYTLACLKIPESPRWLFAVRNDREQAVQILQKIGAAADDAAAQSQLDEMAAAAQAESQSYSLWKAGLNKPILLAFLIAAFNQLSGINAILYFAPRIFEMTGLGEQAAFLQSIGMGLTNLIFTFVGIWLIDRLGRRTLLYIGSLGYIVSLGLCSWAFASGSVKIVPTCLFAFIAAHAVGQGAVIWVFISEIFPNRHRAAGTALGSGTHWVFAAVLATVFPTMVEWFSPAVVFGFFAGMMVLQLVWVKLMVPETKGVPLEQLQRELGIK